MLTLLKKAKKQDIDKHQYK